MGGFRLIHNNQEVDAIDASRSECITLLKVAAMTGDINELSRQDINKLPEGRWGNSEVKTIQVGNGWTQKAIKNSSGDVITISCK